MVLNKKKTGNFLPSSPTSQYSPRTLRSSNLNIQQLSSGLEGTKKMLNCKTEWVRFVCQLSNFDGQQSMKSSPWVLKCQRATIVNFERYQYANWASTVTVIGSQWRTVALFKAKITKLSRVPLSRLLLEQIYSQQGITRSAHWILSDKHPRC